MYEAGLSTYLTLAELGAFFDHVVVYAPPFLAAFTAAFAAVHSKETAARGVLSTTCKSGFFPALRLARRLFAAEARGCTLPDYHAGRRSPTRHPFHSVPLPRGGASGWMLIPLPEGDALPPPPFAPCGAQLPYHARSVIALSAASTAAREAQIAAANRVLISMDEARQRVELQAQAQRDAGARAREDEV